jgi:hypothetical protein
MKLARQLSWLDHRLPAVPNGHVDMVEWPESEGLKRRRETPADASRPKMGRETHRKAPRRCCIARTIGYGAFISAPSLPPKSQSTNAVRLVCGSFAPPSVASPFGHGVAVLKARSMGRGIGGLGSNVGPLALFQSTSDRDVTRNALRGPGATTKLESAPPRCVGGDCGWAGRAGEPLLGGYGVHRPRRRYAAGDGGQINKLWERREYPTSAAPRTHERPRGGVASPGP